MDFYYIDLFDEYMAMRIGWEQLTYEVDTHHPEINLETELLSYKHALEFLYLQGLKQNFQELMSPETEG